MLRICMCSYLLLALMMREMKALKVTGRVGETVTFTCSNWKAWTDVKTKNKYLCVSPCNRDEHIIVKATFSSTEQKDRIKIRNIAEGLFVTFTDLKSSDSKKYYCGVERYVWDSFVEVDLQVTDGPKTSVTTTTVGSTVSFAVTTTSTMSSTLDLITDSSVSYTIIYTTAAAAVNRAGSVPYLIVGFIVLIVSLIVLLQLMRTVRRRHEVVRSFHPDSPQDNQHVDLEYENIRREDQQTESQSAPSTPAHLSTTNPDVDLDSLYTNNSFLKHTQLQTTWKNHSEEDHVLASTYEVDPKVECAESIDTDPLDDMYSLLQLPKEKTEDSTHSSSTQCKTDEEDFKYSLPLLADNLR